jgi:hypothetical protein
VSIERRNNVDTTDENILHIGSGSNTDLIIYKNSESGRSYQSFCCWESILICIISTTRL